jgi:hypothetical protein
MFVKKVDLSQIESFLGRQSSIIIFYFSPTIGFEVNYPKIRQKLECHVRTTMKKSANFHHVAFYT